MYICIYIESMLFDGWEVGIIKNFDKGCAAFSSHKSIIVAASRVRKF